jgi:hypothetical protein
VCLRLGDGKAIGAGGIRIRNMRRDDHLKDAIGRADVWRETDFFLVDIRRLRYCCDLIGDEKSATFGGRSNAPELGLGYSTPGRPQNRPRWWPVIDYTTIGGLLP